MYSRLPHICHHGESHGTTSCRETTKPPAHEDGSEVGRNAHRDLPDVDEEQTELEDRPSSQLFTPGRPQLATESVGDQEDGGTKTRCLRADAKLRGDTGDGIAVKRCVEVHGDLDKEDDTQNSPLLPCREGETELIVAVFLCDLVAIVCAVSLVVFLVGGAEGVIGRLLVMRIAVRRRLLFRIARLVHVDHVLVVHLRFRLRRGSHLVGNNALGLLLGDRRAPNCGVKEGGWGKNDKT
jgi:hypothetical protein